MLTFCQFYKSYVDSFCINQKYKVRKIVSTRYDLNQPVYQEKYLQLIPQLNLITQQYEYKPTDYNYLNTEVQVNLPTQEELEKAKQYESKIPDYTISSGGGNIQAGVIEDNPTYSSYDYSAPPPEFASISGNVELKPEQINAAGQPPAGFNNTGMQGNMTNQGYSSAQGQGYSSGGQIYTNAPSGQGYIPPNA